jgi:hypothetical protein
MNSDPITGEGSLARSGFRRRGLESLTNASDLNRACSLRAQQMPLVDDERSNGPHDFAFLNRLAQFLAKVVIPHHPEGFTFDPMSWRRPRFVELVYIVSLHGHGRQFHRVPNDAAILSWLKMNEQLLIVSGFYVGGWSNIDADSYELDISVAVRGLKRALLMARYNRQRAIYYPAEDAVIKVGNGGRCDELNSKRSLSTVTIPSQK